VVRRSTQFGQHRTPRYRRWQGKLLHPTEEAFMFFKDEGPVPETLRRLVASLLDAGIPHIILGAMALRAHGYSRTTEDVDVCMRASDLTRFREQIAPSKYAAAPGRSRRFHDPETQVTVDILVAGEIAGRSDKQHDVLFPDPDEAQDVDGLPMPSLARLVELKLVTWRYKDWADVVELIRIHVLDESFAEQLHPVARPFYSQCYDQKLEEDRYNPEIHDAPPG
jgi:hypothetical protein